MTRSPSRLKHVQDTVSEQVRDLPLQAVRFAMFGVGRALLLSDRMTKDYKQIRQGNGREVLGNLRDDAQGTALKVVSGVRTRLRGGSDTGGAQEDDSNTGPARDVTVGKPVAKPAPTPEPAEARGPTEATPAPKSAARPSPKPASQASPESVGRPSTEPAARAGSESAAGAGSESGAQPSPGTGGQTATARPEAENQAKAWGKKPTAADLPVPDYDHATLPQLRARLRGLNAEQVKVLRAYERDHAARAEVLRMFENRITKLNGGA